MEKKNVDLERWVLYARARYTRVHGRAHARRVELYLYAAGIN